MFLMAMLCLFGVDVCEWQMGFVWQFQLILVGFCVVDGGSVAFSW